MNLFGSTQDLLPELKKSILKSIRVNIIVAFILESGVKLLISELKELISENNDIKIRILTGIYLNITEPNALYLLKSELGENLDIRVYKDFNRSFHPKTYIFEYENGIGDVIIGSSNISKTALTYGIEWNYKISNNKSDFEDIINEFNLLYEQESKPVSIQFLRDYNKTWRKTIYSEVKTLSQTDIQPINFQIPALYELNQTREEGYKKAMVIAATGLGKTYLTVFDSMGYKKVLFIAHREEILIQSEKSYKKVDKDLNTGFFIGNKKDKNSDVIFATIQTLGKDKYLNDNYFKEDYFDYIIIDEFHHAAADSYKKLIEYFNPKFLLGVTATPYRTDNKDIYKLCDYNIAYECDLKTGINNSWLVPFKYFGIYDDIDYSKISWRSGKYDLNELENVIMISKRTENIISKYESYYQGKTVAFCVSIKHAEYMAKEFNNYNIKSVALHSGVNNKKERKKIIENFELGDTAVLFVVDIFNEGIDIPNIETVLFLRPTMSYTIFIQQLGRGLRLAPNKEYLTVLDFVGNYKGADFKYSFLTGYYNPAKNKKILPIEKDYKLPDNCQTYFDFELLNLFKELKKTEPIKLRLIEEYKEIKKNLGKTPTVMDIFEQSDYSFNIYRHKFKSWLEFRNEIGDLNDIEKKWLTEYVLIGEFLLDIEKTSMSKSYKIPTILSFINNSLTIKEVTSLSIANKFMDFYTNNRRYQLDLNDKSNKNWRTWQLKDFEKLAIKNPIKFLSTGAMKKYFNYNKTTKIFSLNEKLFQLISKNNKEFTLALKDRLSYKKSSYFQRKFN